MSAAEKERLVANIAASLAQVSKADIVQRSITNFRNADRDYGDRVAKAVEQRRARR
jgi:catalase